MSHLAKEHLDKVVQQKRKETLLKLRQAIQDSELYCLVRTENDIVITGVVDSEYGFVLTED